MRRALAVLVIAAVVGFSSLAGGASAAPEAPASCKALFVTAGIGQPGAVADAIREFNAMATEAGLPPGLVVSAAAAHLKEEDFQACVDALFPS
jgi:hypothetical protein